VVPDFATSWYYFREQDFAGIRSLYEIGNTIANAAAMATETTVTRQVLGYAAPNFGNKPLAEAAYENIKAVGMPTWSDDDQAFAKAVQEANKLKVQPLATEVSPITTPESAATAGRGTSDDIGDVMWAVPTITIRYPSNIPNTIGHNVTAAIAMATPIAHKGAVAAGKAAAMTVLDLMSTPELITAAKDYYNNVQLKDTKYDSVLTPQDKPGIHLNKDLMEKMRPPMSKLYYDPKKYRSYLEQLGIAYPNLTTTPASGQ
jgi:aminobenzoyl-glutamate utilization protein B